jgi:hypothetical protein
MITIETITIGKKKINTSSIISIKLNVPHKLDQIKQIGKTYCNIQESLYNLLIRNSY